MSDPTVLSGRYRLGPPLGRGGMATVSLGLDIRLGRPVAIKQLAAKYLDDPAARRLFDIEARCAAQLNHPAIVRVFDSGEDTDASTGAPTPYIVTEYVAGETLGRLLRREGPLQPARALQLTIAVLEAVTCCHDAGIVHADIKPGNVMVTRTGQIKLMDFGLARHLVPTESDAALGAEGFGTAKYLSPEQIRRDPLDGRSDVYSTGCLLYELLVGQPPFAGDDYAELAYQHLASPPPPPSRLRPRLGTAFDDILARGLAKHPDERYPTAAAMRADLHRLLAETTRTRPTDQAANTPQRDHHRPRRPTRGRRILLVAAGVVGMWHHQPP